MSLKQPAFTHVRERASGPPDEKTSLREHLKIMIIILMIFRGNQLEAALQESFPRCSLSRKAVVFQATLRRFASMCALDSEKLRRTTRQDFDRAMEVSRRRRNGRSSQKRERCDFIGCSSRCRARELDKLHEYLRGAICITIHDGINLKPL